MIGSGDHPSRLRRDTRRSGHHLPHPDRRRPHLRLRLHPDGRVPARARCRDRPIRLPLRPSPDAGYRRFVRRVMVPCRGVRPCLGAAARPREHLKMNTVFT